MNQNPFEAFGGAGAAGSGAEDFARKWREQRKQTGKRGPMSRGKKGLLIALLILVVLGLLLGGVLRFVMEAWQVAEIGATYTGIFWKNVFCRLAVSGAGFLLVFAAALINSFLLRRTLFSKRLTGRIWSRKWVYVAFSFVFALLFGGIVGENTYQELLTALHATEFGTQDPLFGRDIGYYIFVRPFFSHAVGALKNVFLLQTVFVAASYGIVFSITGTRKLRDMIRTEPGAVRHVLIHVILFYLAVFCSYRLTAEDLMYGSFGRNEVAGAGFIESAIWKPYYAVAPWLILISVVLTVLFLYRKKWKGAILSVAAIPAVYVAVALVAFVTQQLVVAPDERTYQLPYIQHNIEATRKSFGLQDMQEVQFDFQKPLTEDVIETNQNELLNTRILDFNASLTAYNQLQYLRKYYTFNDIDVVPYDLEEGKTGVFLSARELNQENLEASARSYTNEKFRYTHGFGVVASRFNQATEEGQPKFSVKDIPPVSTDGMPEVTQPRIYYGENTNSYVIVGSDNKELDYSEGYTDVEYTFQGDTGVRLGFFQKLLFSIYYKDYKMFFSGNIDENSKILINRNVAERVKKVAPFFQYEEDPCIVLGDDGALYWVIDGYTCSDRYPYAQTYGGVNYVRNSVKAVVDAYTGNVTFYMIDPQDPMAQTYDKIYPDLFSKDPIPASIQNHLTVPEGLFKLQSRVYQQYHVNDAGPFYDQSDVWRIATEKYENNEVTVAPYFNMFTLEGETEADLVLTIPYVLGDKYNMVGILMQRSDPEHYGELVLYRIPKSNTVYGPMQIENKIDNDPDISREMTLWGQGGSTVIRGNLLVIPFENSIFYVEPVYITSHNNASLPELKRIIVAYKDAVAMEPTLSAALSKVLQTSDGLQSETLTEPSVPPSAETPEPPPVEQTAIEQKIQSVLDAYDAFRASGSDWSAAGENLETLGEAIESLR